MANFSMVVSGSAAVTYLLDTHGPNALHCLAISNFLKNMALYGFSFFANGMVETRGVKVSLLILAACQAACMCTSVFMYVWGKRVRGWVSNLILLFVFSRWVRVEMLLLLTVGLSFDRYRDTRRYSQCPARRFELDPTIR